MCYYWAARFTFYAWINPCSVFATFVTEGNLGSCAEMRPLIFNQQLLASKFDLCPMKIEGKCQFEKSDVITRVQFSILGAWTLLIRISFYSIVIYRSVIAMTISYYNMLLTMICAIETKMRIIHKCIINNELHVVRLVNNGILLVTKYHISSRFVKISIYYCVQTWLWSKHDDRLFYSYLWLNSCLSVYWKFSAWKCNHISANIITFLKVNSNVPYILIRKRFLYQQKLISSFKRADV